MKTQVSILVKNESLFSRAMTLMWFVNIFKKMSVDVYIDSMENKMTLKAQNEPYLIDVEPGQHEIMFMDPKAGSKAVSRGITGAFLGAGIMGGAGGSLLGGAMMGYESASNTSVKDNVISFALNEGDLMEISVQCKSNGSVKLKVLNK